MSSTWKSKTWSWLRALPSGLQPAETRSRVLHGAAGPATVGKYERIFPEYFSFSIRVNNNVAQSDGSSV